MTWMLPSGFVIVSISTFSSGMTSLWFFSSSPDDSVYEFCRVNNMAINCTSEASWVVAPIHMLESLKIIIAAISWRSGAAGISSWYLYNNRKVLPQWCVWLISGVLSPWRQSPWRQRWWRAERRRKWRRPRAPCACCTTWPVCCRATLTMTLSI